MILKIKDANVLWFCRIWKKYSKNCKTTAKKASWLLCYHLLPKICFIVKVPFFQKNQLGIGVWWGKLREMGKKWKKVAFYSKCGVIIIHSTNFILFCTNTHHSLLIIAFRSNFSRFCVIWGEPNSGTQFFFLCSNWLS